MKNLDNVKQGFELCGFKKENKHEFMVKYCPASTPQ